jgi:Arc/MetJ family transcription regulator
LQLLLIEGWSYQMMVQHITVDEALTAAVIKHLSSSEIEIRDGIEAIERALEDLKSLLVLHG